MKSRLMKKTRSAFLRYVEREYKDVLDIMATSRMHSIKPTQNSEKELKYYSNKTTKFLQSNKTTKNGT